MLTTAITMMINSGKVDGAALVVIGRLLSSEIAYQDTAYTSGATPPGTLDPSGADASLLYRDESTSFLWVLLGVPGHLLHHSFYAHSVSDGTISSCREEGVGAQTLDLLRSPDA